MSSQMLIVFVDAFSFDYLEKRPFLSGFWQNQLPLETIIGYSSSIVPALWSGQYPDQMQSWNEFFYKPRMPYRLPRLLDVIPIPYLRNFMRRALFRYGGRFGLYRQSMAGIPSSVEHLFSRSTIRYHDFPPIPLGDLGLNMRLNRAGINYRFWFNDHNFKAQQALADIEPEIEKADVFIYGTATIDADGHIFGAKPDSFDGDFSEIEAFIQGATTRLQEKGPTTVIVISDHGMTDVGSQFNVIDWLKPWDLGREYIAFLDSTMARFWDVGTIPLQKVIERIEAANVGRFITETDRDQYGLNFSDNRYGDAIFLLNPGLIMAPSFLEMPYVPIISKRIKAMHGYLPGSHSSTRGVFLYRSEHELPYEPKNVTDVADLIESIVKAGSYASHIV